MLARTGSIVLACLLAAALAGPAHAARPILVGPGGAPGVAVDAAGTAHVAYNSPHANPGGAPLMYCAWPRGARGCVPRPIVADGASPLAQPALVSAGPTGEVTIVSARETLQMVRSADGGATFGPPVTIGTGRFFDGAFAPDGQVGLSFPAPGNFDEYRQRSAAGPPDASAFVHVNHGHSLRSAVAFLGPRPVVVSGARQPKIAVSSWSGQGDVHDPATWAGPFTIGSANSFALASGPRGLFVAHEVSRAARDRIVVRKFAGERFGRARGVPSGRLGLSGIVGVALAQDATGRLVAAWYSPGRRRIEVSASRTGTRWTPARVLATGVGTTDAIEVGLGPDGRGLVVWGGGDQIHAVRVSAPGLL